MSGQPPAPKTAELVALIQALYEGRLGPADAARLDAWLRDDEAARWVYVQYLNLYAGLAWDRTPPKAESAADASPPRGAPTGEPPLPPIVIDTGGPLAAPFFALTPSLGGWLFSYAAATVVTGVLLLVLWMSKVSYQPEVANLPPAPPPVRGPERQLEYVGRISGVADCQWADAETAQASREPSVPLGRKYALLSGLLEISYQTGAKVILEGPCTYEITSSHGGYLSRGKLTARVETEGEGGRGKAEETDNQKSEVRGQESPFPLPPSAFVVRTPTAIVTDLGTEFGVEVSKKGTTTSHVFQGTVRMRLVAGAGPPRDVLLHKNESARAEKDGGGGPRLVSQGMTGNLPRFVRSLVQPPKLLDLLDIVAGGDGTGQRREHGIDPVTGMQDWFFAEQERQGRNQYRRIYWHGLIDGVCNPDGGAGPVQLDSARHTFDGFPHTSGAAWGSIWARAAEVAAQNQPGDQGRWVYAIGPSGRYMPEGRGLLCFSKNVGLSFNLEAMRKLHAGARPARFRATAGVPDAHALFPNLRTGTADVWLFVDGELRWKRLGLRPRDGSVTMDVNLGPASRFLTLVSTDVDTEGEANWVVFGDPVLEMVPTESDGTGDRSQPLRKEKL